MESTQELIKDIFALRYSIYYVSFLVLYTSLPYPVLLSLLLSPRIFVCLFVSVVLAYVLETEAKTLHALCDLSQ